MGKKSLSVQSVDRALTLLKLVADSKGPILASDLAIKAALNRTTVWRLLETLEAHGFVERDPFTKGYQLGYAVTRMAMKVDQYSPLIRRARPSMERLRDEVKESVLLSVPKPLGTLTIDQIDPLHSVRLINYVNATLPLHCTSNGKILLSRLSRNELDILLQRPLEKYTSKTITDPEQLRKEIDLVRRRGFGTVVGELDENENGISAPIIDEEDNLIAFLSVCGPDFRFTKEIMISIAPRVIAAANEIARSLE